MSELSAGSAAAVTAAGNQGRRLSDKILSAFTLAYEAGEHEIAEVLREALIQAEARRPEYGHERRSQSALRRAELWADFVEARQAHDRAASEATLEAMKQAYRRWSGDAG